MQIECYANSVECGVFAVMPPAVTVITSGISCSHLQYKFNNLEEYLLSSIGI